MIVFLNGQFVSEERATVSVFDRGFLYGDGLFETIRVANGRPFRWAQHFDRLKRGADFLRIRLPVASDALPSFVNELIRQNGHQDALLRLTLSRGIGPRGYSPRGADEPTLVMALHPFPGWSPPEPPQWKLATASFRLPARDPLAQFKTCNKLAQVLARAEVEASGADEALLLNTDGHVVEAASSNLFWIEGEVVCTPPVASGVLAGVTRSVVLELCQGLGLPTRETSPRLEELLRASGICLSLSSWGVVAARELDGQAVPQSALVRELSQRYARLLEAELTEVTKS